MDNLTHTLFGATLARTPLGRAGRGTTAALLLASNAPDIDIVATAGGAASYLQWHRGPTHGPLGIVALGIATAGLVWAGRRIFDRKAADRGSSFARLCAVSMLGVLLHLLMDVPTAYGTRLLSPFDWRWFTTDWMPIVDVYLLAILAGGLLFRRRAAPRSAAIALVCMVGLYGLRAAAHHQALDRAPAVLGVMPDRCEDSPPPNRLVISWPREGTRSAGRFEAGRCLLEFAAIPTFLSPFRWRAIAHLSNGYEAQQIDLVEFLERPSGGDEGPRRGIVQYPNHWTRATFRASETRSAQVFLGFSRFPAVSTAVDRDGMVTVRWHDLRFVEAAVPGERQEGRAAFFGATVRLDPDGRIVQERLGQ